MTNKIILFLYKRLIKRMALDYEDNKECLSGELYLKQLNTNVDIFKALKQQLLIPDFYETYSVFIEALANFVALMVALIVILACPFYNIFKILIFPFRIYIVKTVRKEILKRIDKQEQETRTNEFLKLCNKDFSNVDFVGTRTEDEIKAHSSLTMSELLFWYNEEVIRAHGVDNFRIKDIQ